MIVENISCDCCKKDFTDDEMTLQEFMHVEFGGGYGAPFGDGVRATMDLCPACQVKLLGDYIQYPDTHTVN